MKALLHFIAASLLLFLLTDNHAFSQPGEKFSGNDKLAQQLPFRISVSRDTSDGDILRLAFSNESNLPVTIDGDALRLALPSILINEKTGENEGAKVSQFSSTKAYTSHPLTREQILGNSSRAITVKPHGTFEVSVPLTESIKSAQKRFKDQPIVIRFFIPKLILAGQFSKMTSDDLFALKFSSNSLRLK